jgi:hypothetical protein
MPPETRYAASGDVNIAYQVLGDGPRANPFGVATTDSEQTSLYLTCSPG